MKWGEDEGGLVVAAVGVSAKLRTEAALWMATATLW